MDVKNNVLVLNDESKKIIPLDFSKKIILSLMKENMKIPN